MQIIKIKNKTKNIEGNITLDGSKSISNRALIVQALCEENFKIKNISTSQDTQTLQKLLKAKEEILDTGHAGTTFRFLTAYLAFQKRTQILTGSERMKQRPIGILVKALRQMGANIEYLGKESFPPLKINSPDKRSSTNKIKISGSTSSQYISALLLIAPTLPNGLELELTGKTVSVPYILMTLKLMEFFGIIWSWEKNTIKIAPQKYRGKEFPVEADWSAASYYYAIAAFAENADIQLNGLQKDSLQGDNIIAEIGKKFGVKTEFNPSGVRLTKRLFRPPGLFEFDFINCPDITQTVAVMCGGLGIKGKFTGLETLTIKETDRITALKNELAKINITITPFSTTEKSFDGFEILGQAVIKNSPQFETYNDHRMAMSLTPLAIFNTVKIRNPQVVKKSYPAFWNDIKALGFDISQTTK